MGRNFVKLWKVSVYKIISKKYETLLSKRVTNTEIQLRHIRWRLGYNLYLSEAYFEAITVLEQVCRGDGQESSNSDIRSSLDDRSHVHYTTGLCSVKLYHITHLHSHLENAYVHFQNCIDTLPADMFGILQLPKILLEFGHVMEHYGAFQPALEVYSRILIYFANTRGYFDAMYRTAIIGKHMSDYMTDRQSKEEAINKCMDIFQFLLEAVPPSINEIHVVFMYARSLEASQKQSNNYRSLPVYQSLYDLCRKHDPPLADSSSHKEFKTWLKEPNVWLQFSKELKDTKEPLIILELHNKFLNCLEAKKKRHTSDTDPNLLSTETCLDIAKNRAKFQHYDEAIKFAEQALQQDRFNKEARILLSNWNQTFASTFNVETDAIQKITTVWKNRCWQPGFQKKLKEKLILETESELEQDPWDFEVRHQLAYFAREKWRAKFLFEYECARRIQQCWRVTRMRWSWQTPVRAMYLSRADAILKKYKKKPFLREIRTEVQRIFLNPFCPKDHIIKKLEPLFKKQEKSIQTIIRLLRLSIFRKNLRHAIELRAIQRRKIQEGYAVLIQCCLRLKLARRRRELARLELERRTAAAIVIQKIFRKHMSVLQLLSLRVLRNRNIRRKQAAVLLSRAIPNLIACHEAKLVLRALREERERVEAAIRDFNRPERVRARKRWRNCIQYAIVFAREHFNEEYKRFYSVIVSLMRARKQQDFSTYSLDYIMICSQNSRYRYAPPGIHKTANNYLKLLTQSTVCCDFTFSHVDALMLSAILKNKNCQIQNLIFLQVDAVHTNFSFDLIPSFRHCRSLRSVRILGGKWSERSLINLIQTVQIENPYIRELFIECVDGVESFASNLARSAGLLIADYFNYSIPGLNTLSLHGLDLKDFDLELICKGLSCNRSLQTFILSHNLVTDEGLIKLLKAVTDNSHYVLESLDMSWNLIHGTPSLIELLQEYFSVLTTHHNRRFQLVLLKNPLRNPEECDLLYGPLLKTFVSYDARHSPKGNNSRAQSPVGRHDIRSGLLKQLKQSKSGRSFKDVMTGHQQQLLQTLAPIKKRKVVPGRIKHFNYTA